jgi:epoxide hydrolase-like predicted phosphatase
MPVRHVRAGETPVVPDGTDDESETTPADYVPSTMLTALLLDVGDVLTEVPWKSLERLGELTGRRVSHHGALKPESDPDWQRYLDGDLALTDYWCVVAEAAGLGNDWRALFRKFRDIDEGTFNREARTFIADVQRAGRKVGVLSNDMYSINGPDWVALQPDFANLDVVIDAPTHAGVRKPDPKAFLVAAERLGVGPDEVVFLDDLLVNVEGARAVGMTGVLVDPINKQLAYDRAMWLLGVRPLSVEEALVAKAEALYQAEDLDGIMHLFHPEATVYWNGVKEATGLAEIRAFHVDRLRTGQGERRNYRLRKTLRAAQHDTIAVEWTSRYTTPAGVGVQSKAGEFWTMRSGRLLEWHAYNHKMETP